jgi:hypothetical protein
MCIGNSIYFCLLVSDHSIRSLKYGTESPSTSSNFVARKTRVLLDIPVCRIYIYTALCSEFFPYRHNNEYFISSVR